MAIGSPSGRIGFERVRRDDLAQFPGRFCEPLVREWWGPPKEELVAVESDLDGAGFDMWIASRGAVPFAYVQDGDPAEYEAHRVVAPPGARAVDLLIGPPSRPGRGPAAPFLTASAEHAAARDVTGLPLDPDAGNARALAAYAWAGFVGPGRHRSGPRETVVLHLPIPEGAFA